LKEKCFCDGFDEEIELRKLSNAIIKLKTMKKF